jgi:hypothetical protein
VKVYVAAPYSAPTPAEVEANVARAFDAADALQDAGHSPYCPHLSHWRHMRRARPYEDWIAEDLRWLAVCDAVLRLPGHSMGADREVEAARLLGLPVYLELEEVPPA